MSLRTPIFALFVALTLAACASGPAKRISPPTASVQELSVLADGRWRVVMRVQNFSNVAMTFNLLDARLSINGSELGTITSSVDLDVPGASADVFETLFSPRSTTALEGRNVEYSLKGRITSIEPSGDFPFERASRLSPVPGLPGTWR